SAIKNSERVGKKEAIIDSSNLVKNLLEVLKEKGYVESYEVITKNNYNKLKVNLNNKINELNVIKPRHSFKRDEINKFKERYLLGENVGFLLISTPKDKIITDREIKNEGGVLIGYIY
ncbi:MAG: 30S ribosomal protein S8, partial [Candidatus Aenigmarchaeota archaeon]|nr:30S ribosomal protein S8 [Candidatus Aenigmarchaeota archaeon]